MVYRFGPFHFDASQRLLFRRGNLVPLKPKAAHVLALLLESHGHLVVKETFRNTVWPETFVEDNNLSQCICDLREALRDHPGGGRYIQTVFGRGFSFVGPVSTEEGAANPAVRRGKSEETSKSEHNGSAELAEAAALRAPGEPPAVLKSPGPSASEEQTENGAQDERRTLSRTISSIWHVRLPLAAVVVLVMGIVTGIHYLSGGVSGQSTPKVFGFRQLTNDGRKKSSGQALMADAGRVYFWEDRGAGMVLASAPVDGGEVSRVPLPPGFMAIDISKNGSEFLGDDTTATGGESLATVSMSGESLRWLMGPPKPSRTKLWMPGGRWSPDGSKIAFSMWCNLFEAEAGGGAIRKLAGGNGWLNWPRWSPDGKKLRFSAQKPKSENWLLWEVNANGTHLHPLTFPRNGFTETCCGDWTHGGKYFIFEAGKDGRHDIWAVREKGGRFWAGDPKPVRLTSGPLDYRFPLPSRDGKEIFVVGEESRGELMRFDLKSHAFVDFMGGISAAEVSFSRDGKWVAYVSYPDYTLWRARAGGSDAVQLTVPPLEAREPHWSPDGKQIAFQGISAGAHYKIYLVSSDGGPVREAVSGDGEESVATWSPDSQSLIYDEPLYRHGASQMFIHRIDLKTGTIHTIPGSAGSWTARLSPDGRYVATLDATPNADPHHLLVLDSITGRKTFTITMPHIAEPTWSRDGKYVYFAVISSPDPALYRVRVRDKKLEMLTSLKGFPVAGLWTGVAPGGSPLLLRDISIQEVYALRVRLP